MCFALELDRGNIFKNKQTNETKTILQASFVKWLRDVPKPHDIAPLVRKLIKTISGQRDRDHSFIYISNI